MKQAEIIKLFMSHQRKQTKSLESIKESMQSINDTNVLHLETNQKFSGDIDKLVKSTDKIEKVFSKAFLLVIAALIVLAGAEKVLSLF